MAPFVKNFKIDNQIKHLSVLGFKTMNFSSVDGQATNSALQDKTLFQQFCYEPLANQSIK
jgi:hypothetical protein